MSYTDLRDFAAEYTADVDGLSVAIEKLGGGTVGQKYTGTWRYVVTNAAGIEVARGQDCETGMPHTHAWVARFVAEEFAPSDSGRWEIGHNLFGSPREASDTFDSWPDAADAVRAMMRDWADEDDESRDEDDDEGTTRGDVDAALAFDGVGPERCEGSAWSVSIEQSDYHRREFWIQPARG